jgi:succinoglycan biosynthesis protein ExoA
MSRRPRILHLRACRFVGGVEKQLLRTAERELSGPYEIILGTFVGPDEGHEFYQAAVKLNLQAVAFPDHFWGKHSGLSELKRFLHDEDIGLLCTHGYKADILGLLAKRSSGVPVVPFLRGWTHEDWKVSLYEFLDSRAILRADRIVALSKLQAERVAKETGLVDRIRTVVNAIDSSPLVPRQAQKARTALVERFRVSPDSFLIASAGRLSPEKGTADLLRAAALLKKSHDNIQWIIFGDGVLRNKLMTLTRTLDIEGHVVFAGFEKSLQELLPGFNLLVNPSISEQMPNIVLEGMAAGIPVVATDVGGVREIAGPEMALALVPPSRPDELARCISVLKTDPPRALALASAGYQRAMTAFSRDLQVRALHELYEEVLAGSSQRDHSADASVSVNVLSEKIAPDASTPLFSVVIPERNEEAHIGAVLQSLIAQDYPRDLYEILVADGMSSDRTRDVIESYASRSEVSIRQIENPLLLSSAGRNQGVRNSRGQFILFIDAHCYLPSNHLLQDSAALFQKTEADCLCRPQPLDAPGNTTFQQAVAAVRSSALAHSRDSTIFDLAHEGFIPPMSSGACYRRAVFDRVGLYDERFDACEDVEFNLRVHQAGFRCYTSPRLQVKYQPRRTLNQLWRQMDRYGKGRFHLAQKHPEASSFFQLVPALLVTWLVVGFLLCWLFPILFWPYVGSFFLYSGGVLISSLWIVARSGWRLGLWAPPIYLVVHLGLGLGYLRGAFGSPLWKSKTPYSVNQPFVVNRTNPTVPEQRRRTNSLQ